MACRFNILVMPACMHVHKHVELWSCSSEVGLGLCYSQWCASILQCVENKSSHSLWLSDGLPLWDWIFGQTDLRPDLSGLSRCRFVNRFVERIRCVCHDVNGPAHAVFTSSKVYIDQPQKIAASGTESSKQCVIRRHLDVPRSQKVIVAWNKFHLI